MELEKHKTAIVTVVGILTAAVVGFLNSDQLAFTDHALSWIVGVGGLVTASAGTALVIVRKKSGGTGNGGAA